MLALGRKERNDITSKKKTIFEEEMVAIIFAMDEAVEDI